MRCLALALLPAVALSAPIDRDKLATIDKAAQAAVDRGDCPGAVIVVVHEDKTVYRKAFGHRSLTPKKEAMTVDTIFDLASLTKPLATGTSIMILVQEGKLKLDDPVAKHWPDFAANGKERVTLEHCLLHTSGLIADNPLADYAGGKATAMKKVAALKLEAEPGKRFKYSDVGFIALGEVVERVGGQPVDRFAALNVFRSLPMPDTGYGVVAADHPRTAPTAGRGKPGQVHDPRAFAMDGVAGHAGLFGTADDLAAYAKAILAETFVLQPTTLTLFTEPVDVPGGKRTRGWDVDTSFSAPRGDAFPKGRGFGHTGFTGTSIWIDPPTKTAVIVLTNRVHISEKVTVTTLRREVGTIVGNALGLETIKK